MGHPEQLLPPVMIFQNCILCAKNSLEYMMGIDSEKSAGFL